MNEPGQTGRKKTKTLLEALDDEKTAIAGQKSKKEPQERPSGRRLSNLTKKQKKFLVLGLAVILGIAGLTAAAMIGGTSYYLTVKQMQAKGKAIYGERIRISGFVVDGTIKSQPARMITDFEVKDKTGGAKAVVSYKGVVPDNFGNSVEVVLDGAYDGSLFKADNMLTKCPSKYKAAK